MGITFVALTMSLDGFIAGPDDGMAHPLGVGGAPLFEWMGGRELSVPAASQPVVDGWVASAGAMISGRRTFDIAHGWKDGHPIDAPIVVLTHQPPSSGEWSPQVRFATTLDDALVLAHSLAGGKDVSVGAASIVQQVLAAGRLDEIDISVAPLLLGAGVRLFDHLGAPVRLEQLRSIPSDGVTHLRYRVLA